ncbi:HD domain-containing protein [Paenibacillus wulumuqiensis]|uniref:HD domain-containing protein n=1 Tax=Paenibacillus wulumuqiensis TaxID=1567107 RepID=UPI0009E457D5|nr:HD domain-containing protein [Paenibacillus wulumuqiensis]
MNQPTEPAHDQTESIPAQQPLTDSQSKISPGKQQMLDETESFVRREMSGEASGHDWWHIHRVVQMTRRLAAAEQADIFVTTMAALLHDIPDEKLNPSKEVGMQRLNGWLDSQPLEPTDREHILDIISNMSYNGGSNPPMRTIEGQVVQDADRLDAIGAIAIARCFVYAGHVGDLMYDPEVPVREQMTAEEYRNGQSTAINHFHEKLLKLKDRINTPAAREIAEERHQYMQEYVNRFYREWNGM